MPLVLLRIASRKALRVGRYPFYPCLLLVRSTLPCLPQCPLARKLSLTTPYLLRYDVVDPRSGSSICQALNSSEADESVTGHAFIHTLKKASKYMNYLFEAGSPHQFLEICKLSRYRSAYCTLRPVSLVESLTANQILEAVKPIDCVVGSSNISYSKIYHSVSRFNLLGLNVTSFPLSFLSFHSWLLFSEVARA